MRVLFSLLDAAVGGGQRVAIEVARRLTAAGDFVGLLVPEDGPAAEEFRALGADVHQADLQTLRRIRGIDHAAELAREFNILYSHTSVPGEILAGRVSNRVGIPHVVHRHADLYFSSRTSTAAIQRWLFRRTLQATPFIAVAPHIAASLERLGIERERITVVPNGVDVEAIRERGRIAEAQPAALSVGALGRFDPSRGLGMFVEATRRMNVSNVAFVIGGGPGPFDGYESAVRRAAAELGVPIVDPGSAGVEFLASLDIVVVPSRYEGSPLTLFEAMALGKPIVASRIPGIQEVLGPTGAGVLVAPDDTDELARAIGALVADSGRREALGRAALDTVRREYPLNRVLDRIVEVLRRTVRTN